MTLEETTYLNAARSGDQEAFAQLVEPYRKQLLVHCYRILGSFEDAEDMLQETLVRVWKRLDSFEGRSSLRAWLYKIATNASLDALDSRRVRGLPKELYGRGDPTQPLPAPVIVKSVNKARRLGMLSHEAYFRMAAPGSPEALEYFQVDTWMSGEGMGAYYSDEDFLASFNNFFTAEAVDSVWVHPKGDWVEW